MTIRSKGNTGTTRSFSSKANVSICIWPHVHTEWRKVGMTRPCIRMTICFCTKPRTQPHLFLTYHWEWTQAPHTSSFSSSCISDDLFIMFVTLKVSICSKLSPRGSFPDFCRTFPDGALPNPSASTQQCQWLGQTTNLDSFPVDFHHNHILIITT